MSTQLFDEIQTLSLEQHYALLRSIASEIQEQKDFLKRLELFKRYPIEIKEIQDPFSQYIIHQIILCKQEHLLEGMSAKSLQALCRQLAPVDRFYFEIGGLIGYQLQVLKRLLQKQEEKKVVNYLPPQFFNIRNHSQDKKDYIEWGISHLDQLAELYPIGGAADRLGLIDAQTQKPLPAAQLKFMGKTLLEWLFDDLRAREYLYYLKTNKQLTTPVGLMSSLEKDNHFHIEEILEQNHYFHRKKETIRLFVQPLVPVFDAKGKWENLFKPGGHGVLWKLAENEEIFDWFEEEKKTHLSVRQINNPICGTDDTLLTFFGLGLKTDKEFGFVGVDRIEGMNEGVNVIKEIAEKKVLSNVEYCDVENLEKIHKESTFLANTNILFAKLQSIRNALHHTPYPGLLINFKENSEKALARLELTMQDIAENFEIKESIEEMGGSFLLLAERNKALSAIKRKKTQETVKETIEAAFVTYLNNVRNLLELCKIKMPDEITQEQLEEKKLSFYAVYAPYLGPLYEQIQSKICGGEIARGSYLDLQISDLKWENVRLNGALQIQTDYMTGHFEEGIHQFSPYKSFCILENIEIQNDAQISMEELPYELPVVEKGCKIILEKNAGFVAKGVSFTKEQTFHVPEGKVLVAYMQNNELQCSLEARVDYERRNIR